jgi:hypothetical protein
VDCGLIFENSSGSFAKMPGLTGIDSIDISWTRSGPLDPDPAKVEG